jgi:hypothetical protein
LSENFFGARYFVLKGLSENTLYWDWVLKAALKTSFVPMGKNKCLAPIDVHMRVQQGDQIGRIFTNLDGRLVWAVDLKIR